MGGDSGPEVMVAGAAQSWRRRDDLSFILFGDEPAIRTELAKYRGLASVTTIVHCDDVISGDDRPREAIRRAKTSSMGRAIAAVKEGEAQAMVSGGNTGAMMAMAKLALRTMPGIHRPA
jgi:glycerol-3-phosphate acyltransferase PlsX